MRRAAVLLGLTLGGATAAAGQAEPVRVADLIGMTLFGSDAHNGASQDIHVVSHDGRRVAVVVQRGNLAQNTVDFALLVLAPMDSRAAPHADTIVSLAARSNDHAISHVVWLADDRTLAFLGARAGERPQVYTVDVGTHALRARTSSATGVASFELGPAGDPIIYQEQGTVDTSAYSAMRAHGFAVAPGVLPSDLISGDWHAAGRRARMPRGYRMVAHGRDAPLPLPDSTSPYRECAIQPGHRPPLNPTGDAALLLCAPHSPPAFWLAYRNPP